MALNLWPHFAASSCCWYDMLSIDLNAALKGVEPLKQVLMGKGEVTHLFGQLRVDGLALALGTIEPAFGDELFYPNR